MVQDEEKNKKSLFETNEKEYKKLQKIGFINVSDKLELQFSKKKNILDQHILI